VKQIVNLVVVIIFNGSIARLVKAIKGIVPGSDRKIMNNVVVNIGGSAVAFQGIDITVAVVVQVIQDIVADAHGTRAIPGCGIANSIERGVVPSEFRAVIAAAMEDVKEWMIDGWVKIPTTFNAAGSFGDELAGGHVINFAEGFGKIR
jgi:hypothetical protein